MDLEKLAIELEASTDYRVLRRLPMLKHYLRDDDYGKTFKGLYLDVEATGLNVEKDEITELAAIPFEFAHGGLILGPEAPLHFYNEPNAPISAEITALTGINTDMVRGHKLDVPLLEQVLSETDLVVAHNAEYDRKMVERYLPAAAKKCWACSMEEVPWPKRGKRLEYIVADMGFFYDAHNAIDDCRAGLFALTQQVAGKPAFAHVLAAAKASTWRVRTVGLKFNESVNELLKERKYYWNPGTDGKAKAWNRVIATDAQEAEISWLQQFAYGKNKCTATFDKVTAFQRYSNRV